MRTPKVSDVFRLKDLAKAPVRKRAPPAEQRERNPAGACQPGYLAFATIRARDSSTAFAVSSDPSPPGRAARRAVGSSREK